MRIYKVRKEKAHQFQEDAKIIEESLVLVNSVTELNEYTSEFEMEKDSNRVLSVELIGHVDHVAESEEKSSKDFQIEISSLKNTIKGMIEEASKHNDEFHTQQDHYLKLRTKHSVAMNAVQDMIERIAEECKSTFPKKSVILEAISSLSPL